MYALTQRKSLHENYARYIFGWGALFTFNNNNNNITLNSVGSRRLYAVFGRRDRQTDHRKMRHPLD